MLSDRISRLSAPPRQVPLHVACSALLGITGSIGAIFFIFGMVFVVLFSGGFRPFDELRLALSTATARGIVTDVTPTNATENDVPVYKYEFIFSTPGGREVKVQNYATGQIWSEGNRVQVRYVPGKPTIARMEEARLSSFPPWVLALTLIFPAVGAALFVTATVQGLRQVALLRHGEIAGAQILSERATGTRVNDVPVIEYSYEFEAHDGESYLGSSKSLPSQRIGDEAKEPVLYLPGNPSRSALTDALPLRYPLDVDGFGQWATHESIWPAVRYVLIWAGIVIVVGIGLLRALGLF